MWWIVVALAIGTLYALFDVNYFIRVIFTVIHVLLVPNKLKVNATHTIYGICTTNDVDVFLNHMNNARYLRELDFSRWYWYGRTRFWDLTKANKLLQGECMIRYRRMMPVFKPYKIETRLMWWDEKSIFLEHKFITLHDDFVRAVAYSRQRGIGQNMVDYMERFPEFPERPEQPAVLRGFIDSIDASSQSLRD